MVSFILMDDGGSLDAEEEWSECWVVLCERKCHGFYMRILGGRWYDGC